MIKKSHLIFSVLLIAVSFLTTNLPADNIKGYFIPEYYYVGANNDVEGLEGQHGLWVRRLYFGYNTKLGGGFSARVRLEFNQAAFEKSTIVPYIKNLHLKYKISSALSMLLGIMEPPSFNKIEKFWGYRYIEKTAPDLFKLASSRDFGIGLEGSSNGLVYTVMYGNYGSNKGEWNKGKAFYGRVGYIKDNMHLEANGHFASDGGKDIAYLAGFAGIKGGFGRIGAGFYYKSEAVEGEDTQSVSIISLHGTLKLGKKAEALLRYDHFLDNGLTNPGGYLPVLAKGEQPRLIIAGLNFKVNKNIQISPNLKFVTYGGDSELKSDFYFNLTAKIGFSTTIGEK